MGRKSTHHIALAPGAGRHADPRAGGPGRSAEAACDEVEQTLRAEIRDDVIVGQLTTAVLSFG